MSIPTAWEFHSGPAGFSTTPEELADAAAACTDVDNGFDFDRWGHEAMGEICPLWLLRQLPNMPACHVSIEFDARGPNNTITCRESSALLALAEAVGVIRRGAADCMMSAPPARIFIRSISPNSACSTVCRGPRIPKARAAHSILTAMAPLWARAEPPLSSNGITTRFAAYREIYAEIVGIAAGCDGTGFSNGPPGTGLVRAVQSAMRQAGMVPSELGHSTLTARARSGTTWLRPCALHRAFDDDVETIPVTALKSYFGHFDAGSGSRGTGRQPAGTRAGHAADDVKLRDTRSALSATRRSARADAFAAKSALTVNRTAMGQTRRRHSPARSESY